MVLEPDYRVRGQHTVHQAQAMMQQVPQQQNWGGNANGQYQQHVQQRQVPPLPAMVMQPGAPFHGAFAIPVQGMPFQGPVMFPVNAPAPPHLLAMHHPQHHVWAGQPYMQHTPQQLQQARMQPERRVRYSMPNQMQQGRFPVQAGAGPSQPSAQAMPPGVLLVPQPAAAAAAARMGPTAATGVSPVISKSAMAAAAATAAALAQHRITGAAHGRQDSPAAVAAGSVAAAVAAGAVAAAAAAGSLKKAPSISSDSADSHALGVLETVSNCSTGSTGDWAESSESPDNEGKSSWAWLVDGVLQQVVVHLEGNSSSLRAFRATCQHWRACADATMQALAPSTLLPKDLIKLFPALQHLQLVSCRNVRNRDLYVLAQSNMHLTSLVLGDDTNKPWVTNRGIESIARMTRLKFIALHDCNSITNNGITALSSLTRLDRLSLRGCRKLTNNGMEVVKQLTGVTKLNLYGCKRLSDAGITPLQGLPLLALSLGQTRIRDEGLCRIAALTRLTELHLVKEEMRENALRVLSSLSSLEVLSLRDMKLTNQSVAGVLAVLPSLRDLSLYRNTEVNSALLTKATVLSMVNLTALDLRETGISDPGVAECTQLTNLRCLKLKPPPYVVNPSTGLRMEGFPSVSALTQLTSLGVALPLYHPAMMASIGKLTGLRELDLGRGYCLSNLMEDKEPLGAWVYAEVAKNTQLTALDLSRRNVDERSVHKLMKQLPLLSRLNLGSTGISPDNVRRLERSHPNVSIDSRKSMAEATPDLANFGLAGTLCVL